MTRGVDDELVQHQGERLDQRRRQHDGRTFQRQPFFRERYDLLSHDVLNIHCSPSTFSEHRVHPRQRLDAHLYRGGISLRILRIAQPDDAFDDCHHVFGAMIDFFEEAAFCSLECLDPSTFCDINLGCKNVVDRPVIGAERAGVQLVPESGSGR